MNWIFFFCFSFVDEKLTKKLVIAMFLESCKVQLTKIYLLKNSIWMLLIRFKKNFSLQSFFSLQLWICKNFYVVWQKDKRLVSKTQSIFCFRMVGGNFHGIVVNLLDCNIILREFKFRSDFYIPFQIFVKVMNLVGSHLIVMAKMLDCGLKVSQFKLQYFYRDGFGIK